MTGSIKPIQRYCVHYTSTGTAETYRRFGLFCYCAAISGGGGKSRRQRVNEVSAADFSVFDTASKPTSVQIFFRI